MDNYAQEVTHGEILNRVERLENQMTEIRVQVAEQVGVVSTRLTGIEDGLTALNKNVGVNKARASDVYTTLAAHKMEMTQSISDVDHKLVGLDTTLRSWNKAIKILGGLVAAAGTVLGIASAIVLFL